MEDAFLHKKQPKMKKKLQKVWWNRKNVVPLQPLTKSKGA